MHINHNIIKRTVLLSYTGRTYNQEPLYNTYNNIYNRNIYIIKNFIINSTINSNSYNTSMSYSSSMDTVSTKYRQPSSMARYIWYLNLRIHMVTVTVSLLSYSGTQRQPMWILAG